MKPDYKKIIEKYLPYCKQNIFVIIGIIGIVLISIGDFDLSDRNRSDKTAYSLEDYCCQLETEVTELLREIEGVGEVKVMITTESIVSDIFGTQDKGQNVKGVLIVAEGAGNATVNTRISEAVKALFAIDAHKISIVKMRSQEERK